MWQKQQVSPMDLPLFPLSPKPIEISTEPINFEISFVRREKIEFNNHFFPNGKQKPRKEVS